MTRLFGASLLLFGLLLGNPAFASTYYIEVAVVKHRPASSTGEMFDGEQKPVTTSGTIPNTVSGGGYIQEAKLRQGNYQVISHVSWTQPAQPLAAATPRIIQSNDPEGDSLTGDVTFFDRHYLFIDVELELTDPATRQHYILREKRRVRPKEMHYFDHPKFGVIVYVKRI